MEQTTLDYWQSVGEVVLIVTTILGFVLRAWLNNLIVPLRTQNEHTADQLEQINAKIDQTVVALHSLAEAMATVRESVHSAHHRVDKVEERVTRLEDAYISPKGGGK